VPFDLQLGRGQGVADVLGEALAACEAAGIAESRFKVETLLARAMGCRRLELALCRDRTINPAVRQTFHQNLRRLIGGEPLQYILGDVEFMGHVFNVDVRVLIPRPETEELVEAVLRCEEVRQSAKPRIVDVGTGSGCIAISLALTKAGAEIIATDTSAEALEVARANAKKLGVADRVRFINGDLLAGLEAESVDLVVSNPPYVQTGEWARLDREIRVFEPRAALDGGEDGLRVISRLVPEAVHALKSGGWLFIEIGENQAEPAQALMARAGFNPAQVLRDLSGRDRIARGRKP